MNFFERPPIQQVPNAEPPAYDYLRYLLMNQATSQMMNPYGLSSQGMQNFHGFNQGNRPFNPYGQGFGPPGQQGGAPPPQGPNTQFPPQSQPPQMGGGMGQGGQQGGGMAQLLQMLMSHLGQGGGMQGGGASMVGRGMPQAMPPQGAPQISRPMAPASPTRNYDGTTVGYGGNQMGASFPHHQPQSVMTLMRALGQVPRPHQPGAMGMPQGPGGNPMGRAPRGMFGR